MTSTFSLDESVSSFFEGLSRRVSLRDGSVRDIGADRDFVTARDMAVQGAPLDAEQVGAQQNILERRRTAESNGVLLNGVIYDTSDAGLTRLLVLFALTHRNPQYMGTLQLRDGSIREVTAREVYSLAATVAYHLRACATWEANAIARIQAAEGTADVEAAEAAVLEDVPAGDLSTPTPLEGGAVLTDFGDTRYDRVSCANLTVDTDATIGHSLSVAGPCALASVACTGPVAARGSVSSTSADNVFMGVDSAGRSRLGFVKKASAPPVIAAGADQDISIGHFSGADLLDGVSASTYTNRLSISASTGAVTVANAFVADSVAITGTIQTSGQLKGGACTVTSLTSGSGTVQTTGQLKGGSCTVTSLNSGSGTVQTTGQLKGGAASVASLTVTGTSALNTATTTSLDAGTGTIQTTGQLKGGAASVASLNVTGSSALGATTASSFDAGAGTVQTTGQLNGGACMVTSLNSGFGTVQTTGQLKGGSASVASLNVTGTSALNTTTTASLDAGAGTIQTTGQLKGGAASMASLNVTGSSALGATTASSFDAGAGTVQTTGQLNGGACMVTSLNSGSGTVQTTGQLKGGAASVASLNVTGTSALNTTTTASLDAGAGTIQTTGQLKGGAASMASLNVTGSSALGVVTASSLDAGSGTIQTTGQLKGSTLSVSGAAAITGVLSAAASTFSSITSGGPISAAGSISSTATENVYMGVDSANTSRLGFVKKSSAPPVLAAGSGQDISIGHFSVANLLGGIASGNFAQRILVSASSGAVAITNALSAASASIAGAVTAASCAISGNQTVGGTLGVQGSATVASLDSGSGLVQTTGTVKCAKLDGNTDAPAIAQRQRRRV